jgi:DNA-binding MarR family transcriptional regulator
VTTATRTTIADLASALRPSLLRLTRLVRNQRADLSVSLTELSALGTLRKHGPMSAGELAAHERVQPPSMTKVIASLEQRGLAVREAHPRDRRSAIIALTTAGRELLDSERRRRDAWLSQRLARLTPDERALVRDVIPVLEKLAENE